MESVTGTVSVRQCMLSLAVRSYLPSSSAALQQRGQLSSFLVNPRLLMVGRVHFLIEARRSWILT